MAKRKALKEQIEDAEALRREMMRMMGCQSEEEDDEVNNF